MFTQQLWMALHTEQPRHPIFQLNRRTYTETPPLLTRLLTDVLPFAVLALMVFSAWLLALVFIAGLVLLLLTSGFVYGLIAASGVSRQVAKYRANGRYELVSLSPGGVFGATWAIGTNFLQQTDMLGYLRWGMYRLYLGVFAVLMFALVFYLAVSRTENSVSGYLLPGIFNGLLWLAIHYLDFTRAALAGTLLGWLAPTYARTRFESHLLALSLYLTLQIFSYMTLWIIGWQGLTIVFATAGIDSSVALNLCRLLLVFAIRELTLRGLWTLLLWRLNVNPVETHNQLRGSS